ncbi:DUF2970 domain-containing protein [Alteromonas sp. a30]|uniref:DUF2970 domain-containing protein n=1 Tax=Alteromonas sp. a30 TaxID=2730917 RepID=UPI002282EB42|nr:DUF2970 domain-containing protein [Alteromonas sp. a30]MCY7295306.1 DUF2970 domain-containing protein [Alteromonas sp. a30]
MRLLPSLSSSSEFWSVFKSVAASMFGVQSEHNRQADFQKKSILPFLLVGVLFVIGFIGAIMIAVNLMIGATPT